MYSSTHIAITIAMQPLPGSMRMLLKNVNLSECHVLGHDASEPAQSTREMQPFTCSKCDMFIIVLVIRTEVLCSSVVLNIQLLRLSLWSVRKCNCALLFVAQTDGSTFKITATLFCFAARVTSRVSLTLSVQPNAKALG